MLIFRAISRRGEDSGRALTVLTLLALDVGVDGVRDELIGAAGFVLVDHRGPLAVVTHAGHQVTEPGSVGSELVPGVAEVVDMKACHADRRDRVRPCRVLAGQGGLAYW